MLLNIRQFINMRGVVASLALLLAMLCSVAYAAPVSPVHLTSALHWRSVGPYVGGRVTSLAGIPGTPNVFYAAYAGGGVWKTNDYGHHWKNITDGYFKSDNIGAIAIAPSNPKVIYAGLGDSAPRNTVLADGDNGGMYKSTDGGKTWNFVGLSKTGIISWILVDPHNPEVVYAAALGHFFAPNPQRGVYKSTDGGQTWKKVLYINDKTGVITMAMDPANPQVVYAGAWQAYRRPWTLQSGGPSSGIYKTTDGGAHWSNITHNLGLSSNIVGKVGVAVAPSNPNVVYALVQVRYKPGHPGALFRSDDAGRTWKVMSDSPKITQRAFYYGRVYVDPKDANTLYLPNVGVFVSHDSGKTLHALHPPHGDNHAFWINPDNPQILIEGNDGGASVSLNGGKSWSSEDNQPTGQFYHANLDNQFPFRIYGAQQDEGSWVLPSAVSRGLIPPVPTRVSGGEASGVLPTPGAPWVTYGSGYYSQEWRENRRDNISTQVNPWGEWKFGSAADKTKYRFGWWHHPHAFAPHNPNELLVGANVVFESTDKGFHWKVISPDLTRDDKSKQTRPGGPINADVTGEETYDTLASIAFSPLSDNVIWTGSDDGLVYVTIDGGSNWKQVRPPNLPKWCVVSSISPSHTNQGGAYLTASRYMWDDFHPYVYKTTDYGEHWTEITNGLPDNQYTNSIAQDPHDPNLLFLGTSKTVYFSLDGGSQWQPLTLNLPPVRVTGIAIQPQQHAVVLATFGRAFWVLDNPQLLTQLNSASVSNDAPYLFKPQQTWLVTRSSRSLFGGNVGGQNRPTGTAVFFYLPSSYSGGTPVKLSFTGANGKLIRSFTLPTKKSSKKGSAAASANKKAERLHPGMNRFLWNLRYPNVVDVKGIFESPHSQGPKAPVGPKVVPGTYYVKLSYQGHTQRQPFVVKLDPRLSTTEAQLQQRFAVLMHIQDAIGHLDTSLNHAIDTRSALKSAIASGSVSGSAAHGALASLNNEISNLIDLRIQSDEGSLVYAGKLRAWLSWLAEDIGASFLPATPAQTRAAKRFIGQEQQGVARLHKDIAQAKAVMD